jgi:FkbM family methyltransferase
MVIRYSSKGGVRIVKFRPATPLSNHFWTIIERQIRKKLNRTPSASNLAVISADHLGLQHILQGGYEYELIIPGLEKIFKVAPNFSKGIAIDVGANVGTHSTYFATQFEEVMSFEPNQRIRKLLEWNCEPYSNITVFPHALSDQRGFGYLFISDTNNQGSARIDVSHKKSDLVDQDEGLVELVTLDSVVPEKRTVSLIKIDVEGSELKVLRGALNCIERDHPVIMFEQNSDIHHDLHREIFELLNEFEYSYEWIAQENSSSKLPLRLFSYLFKSLPWFGRREPQSGIPPIGKRIPLVLALPTWVVSEHVGE